MSNRYFHLGRYLGQTNCGMFEIGGLFYNLLFYGRKKAFESICIDVKKPPQRVAYVVSDAKLVTLG